MTNPELLAVKYGAPVPRYTSYPTAPHFTDEVGEKVYRAWLSHIDPGAPVSVYVHIPFCDRLCWFCGCHTKHTTRYEPVRAYLDVLEEEIALLGAGLGFKPEIARLHLGGGSPSLLKSTDLARLRDRLAGLFRFSPKTETSVEIDPSDATDDLYDGLAALGMTRASIGVQDFDPAVQKAINRPQSFAETREVAERLRAAGIHSLNIDALYGLPFQTLRTLEETVTQVISLEPDRIALFGYAHVPWMKKHQKLIDESHLPGIPERFRQARLAENLLTAAGYVRIGIDHFARPGDSLSQAASAGRLRRNFQGYTDDDCETMIGLGASSIGRTPSGYVQNITPTGQYMAAVRRGQLPVARGVAITLEDEIRATVIERLMSDFRVDLNWLKGKYGVEAEPVICEAELAARRDGDGICSLSNGIFTIPETARPFARTVASWFDARMKHREARHSIAV